MSFQAVGWALDHSRAKGFDRLVMLALCHHCDSLGYAGESKATIGRETLMSESTVVRSLQSLAQLGEIQKVEDSSAAPPWWLAIPQNRRPTLWKLVAFLGWHSATPSEPGVSQGYLRGVTEDHDTPSDQGVRDANTEALNSKSLGASQIVLNNGAVPVSEFEKSEPPWMRAGLTYQEWRDTESEATA